MPLWAMAVTLVRTMMIRVTMMRVTTMGANVVTMAAMPRMMTRWVRVVSAMMPRVMRVVHVVSATMTRVVRMLPTATMTREMARVTAEVSRVTCTGTVHGTATVRTDLARVTNLLNPMISAARGMRPRRSAVGKMVPR